MGRSCNYTEEDVKNAFQISRSYQALGVQLGITCGAARKVIDKYRSNLVVSGWIATVSQPLPLYVWKQHNREKDRLKPHMPTAWYERCDLEFHRVWSAFRHEMLIDLIFATSEAEMEKIRQEFRRKVRVFREKHSLAARRSIYQAGRRKASAIKKTAQKAVEMPRRLSPVQVPVSQFKTQWAFPMNQEIWSNKQAA